MTASSDSTTAADELVEQIGGTDDDPSLDDLVAEPADLDDAQRLLDQLSGDEDPSYADDAYGYDQELAENGKWVNWPKLGKRRATHAGVDGHEVVQVLLARVPNNAYSRLLDDARNKFGNQQGVLSTETVEKVLPAIYAKSVFRGVRTVFVPHHGGEVVVLFEGLKLNVDAAPVANSTQERMRLLQRYRPGLQNDLHRVASNNGNYRDASPDVLGN